MENAQNIMKEIIWQNTKKYQQQQDFAQECMHISKSDDEFWLLSHYYYY